VHRDFGADNGGDWIASTGDPLYYRIDREVSPGSSLTDEEFSRGSIQGQGPMSRNSNLDAYLPIPGLVSYGDQQPLPRSEYLSARAQPSRAQANELAFEMYESLLPALRRLPGHENYNFGSASSDGPRYLSQTTTNQVEVVGTSLSGLGDAFVELGHSLQSVGSQWQNRGSQQPSTTAYSAENMQSLLQAARQLIVATSVASPFLQTIPAQPSSNQAPAPASRARDRARELHAAAHSLLRRSPEQAAVFMANHRRARRLQNIDTAMDVSRPRPRTTVEIELTMNHMEPPSQPQPQQQPPPQPRPRPTSAAPMPAQAADTGQSAQNEELMRFVEHLRSVVDGALRDTPPDPAGTSSPTYNPPRSDQGSDARVRFPEPSVAIIGLADRLGAIGSQIGSQTARSDRSNLSTTTEHGSVSDASTRVPRVFAINVGSNGAVSQIPTGFSLPNNPFSISSIFLGTEAGSTASTSRRASMASNTSAAPANDASSSVGNAPGQAAAAATTIRSQDSASSGPRTGEVRTRSNTLSVSSSGNAADAASSSSSQGSRKRHRAEEAPPCDGSQGSSGD
ncbi:hypothetical protein IWW38_003256, partial [Coemansia aciculifera]